MGVGSHPLPPLAPPLINYYIRNTKIFVKDLQATTKRGEIKLITDIELSNNLFL